MLFNQPIQSLTAESIRQLIRDAAPEGQQLDYKSALPDPRDGNNCRDFLVDVVSFANARGGDIVFGVSEHDGLGTAKAIEGLKGFKPDDELRRLQQMIESGVSPPVPVRAVVISDLTEGPVLVLRIPQSWAGPHMVSRENQTRFFVRRNLQNLPMQVQEIRSAFVGSDELPQRIRRFRDQRLALIQGGDAPARIRDEPFYAVHVVPLQAMQQPAALDLVAIVGDRYGAHLPRPPCASRPTHRFNVDGVVSVSTVQSATIRAYAQTFRSGIVEGVEASAVRAAEKGERWFAVHAIERGIFDVVERTLDLYRAHDVALPAVVLVSVVGARGALIPDNGSAEFESEPVDRDTVLLPDVMIDSFDRSVDAHLRPVCDALWQSGGQVRSRSFDETGAYTGRNH